MFDKEMAFIMRRRNFVMLRNRKKFLSVCTACLLFFCSIFSTTVCANTRENPTLLCIGNSYIVSGDEYVAVPIRVENNEDGFFSVIFDIMYNPQILTYSTCVSKDFVVTEGVVYDNSMSSKGMRFVFENIRIANYKKNNSDIVYLIFTINNTLPYTGFAPVQIVEPIIGVGNTGMGRDDVCDVIFSSGDCGVLSYCVVGDSNNDLAVNLKDVLLLRQIIADFDNLEYSFRASDLDGSLSVDLKDVLLLRKSIANS